MAILPDPVAGYMADENGFTVREYQILRLLGRGKSTKEIAQDLKLQISTVNGYVRDLYLKLGLADRLALGMWIASNLPSDPVIEVQV